MSFHRLRLLLNTALGTACLLQTSLAAPAPPNAPQPQGGQPQAETPQQAFTIPFTPFPDHGGPLIHFRINNQEDVTFLADTGAGVNLITDTLVAKLGLKAWPTLGADGKPLNVFGAPLSSVEITNVLFPIVRGTQTGTLNINLTHSPFAIFTREQMGIGPDLPFEGVFGAPFFHTWAVSFDFPGRTMSVSEPGGLSAAQVKALGFGGKGGAVLPLSPCEGDCFSVPAVLSDGRASRRVELEVDTGAQSTSIPLEAAKELAVKFLGTGEIAGGTTGRKVLGKVEVPSLSLGDVRLTNVIVFATDDLATPAVTPAGNDPTPRLAMDVLKNYRVLIDCPARLMYIQPVAPAEK